MRKIEKNLRERLKDREQYIEKLEQDRRIFRETFVHNFKCAIELLGKGQTWNMEYVVKTLAQQFTKFERWYW